MTTDNKFNLPLTTDLSGDVTANYTTKIVSWSESYAMHVMRCINNHNALVSALEETIGWIWDEYSHEQEGKDELYVDKWDCPIFDMLVATLKAAKGGVMIIGEYPCCNGTLHIPIPEESGVFSKENCPHCGAVVWHYLSRIEPVSYTEDDFNERFEINEETKVIKDRRK